MADQPDLIDRLRERGDALSLEAADELEYLRDKAAIAFPPLGEGPKIMLRGLPGEEGATVTYECVVGGGGGGGDGGPGGAGYPAPAGYPAAAGYPGGGGLAR